MLKIEEIPLEKIDPPPFDVRSTPNKEKDAELLASIKEYGILEPICVRKVDKRFQLIYGHRRTVAAAAAALHTIPAIVIEAGDRLTEILKCHENIHQLPVSHVDQASHFCYMREHFHMTETEIAKLVGKSVPYVSQHLSLLESSPGIIEAVQEGSISFSVARELVQVDDQGEQQRLLRIARDDGATADVVHTWVREANRKPLPPDSGPVYVPNDSDNRFNQNPTFPCMACENQTPIGKLMIVRMCPTCFNGFKVAIDNIKLEEASKT